MQHLPRTHFGILLLLTFPPLPCPAQDENPFAAGVRTTPWRSAEEEQRLFRLPMGFEVNLVAAEPEIQKPLNMAFDERGRIWLTCTVEYPYAAPADRPGKDSIRVLEDVDGDGRYEKMTVFADGLNIPIGIYPWKGGCVAYSIPNIWHFEDIDGDGVCDKRTVLYGPFDTSRDTHGMVNSFRRGWDGWVYACHGFNNDSRVRGADGHEIHMQSGNVFRFQLDGSRIEHFTHGQVNPFGMCFDEYFNIFTADCHSKPIYQLLRGGYYPSFGKPHDGLGFVPPMMDHLHGSTAICGLVKYSGENFPPEYRGDFYSGNVMTSRINRNKPEYHGSTIKAIQQPDFVATDDPWFRPVDIQIGPDGAMYVADFYNRIIGHYEVPLPHPGRDRTSGRIWRVRYMGGGDVGHAVRGVASAGNGRDLTKFSASELIQELESPQLEHRLRSFNLLRDDALPKSKEAIREAWKNSTSGKQRASLIWLMRESGLDSEAYGYLVANDKNSTELRVHTLHALSALQPPTLTMKMVAAPIYGLLENQPDVQRAAATTLASIPARGFSDDLIKAMEKVADDDAMLRQALRIALREEINAWSADQGTQFYASFINLSPKLRRELLLIGSAASSAGASSFLLATLEANPGDIDRDSIDFQRIATSIAPNEIERLVTACQNLTKDDSSQAKLIISLQAGLLERGKVSSKLADWGYLVAGPLLTASDSNLVPWTAVPIEGLPPSENPWVVAPRPSRDGDKESLFFYSLPKGEQRSGIFRSGAFALPDKLSFWCAGHSGLPRQPLNDGNYVRLRDSATHALLAESRPPRNDTARQFTWDLGLHAGKRGYIELVDGDTGNAYAWLAVGRFSIPGLNPSDTPHKRQLAAEIIGKLKLDSLKPQLVSLVSASDTDAAARTSIAQALLAFAPDARAAALAAALADAELPDELRSKIGAGIATRDGAALLDCLRDVLKRSPLRLQTNLAQTLAGDAAGADALLTLIEAGQAAPRLLVLPAVNTKLAALKDQELGRRASAITAKLPPADAVLDALISDRRRAFAQAKTNAERGQAVFTKHCANCHQIAGKGATVGPQLDGIGNRGLDRLLEDVLDPNRNVDVAFRTTTLRLADGRVVSGLVRNGEGSQIVLADSQGKEFSVAKTDIEEQQRTPHSLMPSNVPEIIPPDEFADLMAYLLNQRSNSRAE